MAALQGSLGGVVKNWKGAAKFQPLTSGGEGFGHYRDAGIDPANLNAFDTADHTPEAPTPPPVQEMPVAGDAASKSANRNKRAAMQARGGRSSTIITGGQGQRLGD